jgi:hypothetical protein
MSVGSVGKWLSLGALVVALGAIGCGDDDEGGKDSGTTDGGGGGTTGGGTTGGGGDGGRDAGGGGDAGADSGPAVVMCGGKVCSSHSTSAGVYAAGCALNYQDAEVCGIEATSIFGFDAGFTYLEKSAPGPDSTSCGNFLDALDTTADGGRADPDAGTKGNSKQDRFLMLPSLGNIQLSTPGCCTLKGFCSGNSDKGEAILAPGSAPVASNGGFGCMQADAFLRAVPEANRFVRCDPDSGAIIPPAPSDAGTDGGGGDSGASDAGASDASADAAGG